MVYNWNRIWKLSRPKLVPEHYCVVWRFGVVFCRSFFSLFDRGPHKGGLAALIQAWLHCILKSQKRSLGVLFLSYTHVNVEYTVLVVFYTGARRLAMRPWESFDLFIQSLFETKLVTLSRESFAYQREKVGKAGSTPLINFHYRVISRDLTITLALALEGQCLKHQDTVF